LARTIRLAAALILLAAGVGVWLMRNPQTVPEVAQAFAAEMRIPGGVIAWGKAGGAPKVAAFGLADVDSGRPVKSDTRFMLASLTKPMTAALVLTLADQGKLRLDGPLATLFPEIARAPDARLGVITIADLLRHSGGWDSKQTYDPVLDYVAADREFGIAPDDCVPITNAMFDRQLQFDPGTAYAYSNLGYCWLGRVIAAVTGKGYEQALKDWLDARIGSNGLRIGMGETPLAARALPYHVVRDGVLAVEWDDRRLRVLGAAGGWTASVEDYFRFAALPVDPRSLERPAYATEGPSYYGLGWRVWPESGGPVLTHFGAMPGVYNLVLRLPDGLVAVVLYNARPPDDEAAMVWLKDNLGAALEQE